VAKDNQNDSNEDYIPSESSIKEDFLEDLSSPQLEGKKKSTVSHSSRKGRSKEKSMRSNEGVSSRSHVDKKRTTEIMVNNLTEAKPKSKFGKHKSEQDDVYSFKEDKALDKKDSKSVNSVNESVDGKNIKRAIEKETRVNKRKVPTAK